MPPKSDITKEQIIQAAFAIVQEQGLEMLSARNIAQKLNCSTQPIYSLYGNMEEIKSLAYQRVVDHVRYSMTSYEEGYYSPALNLAIGFLHFAKKEQHLFRSMYLSGYKSYDLDQEEFIGEAISMAYMRHSKWLNSASEHRLKRVFLNLAIYLIGLGTLIHSSTKKLEIDEAIIMVREMYETLLLREKEGMSCE